ncbi:MAG TPA: hypothetical protein VEZ71_24615, partial [Archangium sp.]|nr:hypothetical protein [Archangium sp.]
TAGYEHPQAGPIHEGWHWGKQTKTPPPRWLSRAFRRGVRTLLINGVRVQFMASLVKRFPKK